MSRLLSRHPSTATCMRTFSLIAIALLSVALFVCCDYLITRWAERLQTDGRWTWRLLFVLVAAPAGMILFGLLSSRMGLAAMACLVNTGVVVGGAIVGVLIRREQLTTYQMIGLAFGLAALLLLNLGKQSEQS